MNKIYIVCEDCDAHYFATESDALTVYNKLLEKYKDASGEIEDYVWMDSAEIETPATYKYTDDE